MSAATMRTLACVLGLAACAAQAAPRSLDPTFGAIGLATNPFRASAFTLDNGRIVTGGADAANRPVIARLDQNGALDIAFGEAGIAEVPLAYGSGNELGDEPTRSPWQGR